MTALVRRPVAWIRQWHGGQLATLWAAATIGPWQIAVWREALIAERLRYFISPGEPSSGILPAMLGLVVIVLPLIALLATGIWLSGRRQKAHQER